MAKDTEMILVRMPERRGRPGPTFQINPRDAGRVQQLVNAGGVVISGYETKADAESASDQEIGQVEALRDWLPDLTEKQARAIVAAGYTLTDLPNDKDQLESIDGIGPATADKIVEALS